MNINTFFSRIKEILRTSSGYSPGKSDLRRKKSKGITEERDNRVTKRMKKEERKLSCLA